MTISPEPEPPDGWEVFVSSAYPDVPGRPRAELLAELVASSRAIVVAGAHGKTTTAAMIAFALRATGRDPSWIVGGEVPQLGANAGAGEGWLVVEGDESDRSVFALRPQVAVVTNIDLDHHSEFGSRAEVEELFYRGWAASRRSCGAGSSRRWTRSWRSRASTTAATRRPRSPRPSWRASRAAEAIAALASFQGVGRRFELVGTAGGIDVYDDYAHNPQKVARRARDRTGTERRACARALPAASLLPDAPLRGRARQGAGRRRRGRRHATSTRPGAAARGRHREARGRRAVRRRPGSRRAGLRLWTTASVFLSGGRGPETSCSVGAATSTGRARILAAEAIVTLSLPPAV